MLKSISSLSDKLFLYYINSYGKNIIYSISDFKAGDKVLVKELEQGMFESEIDGREVFVNYNMSRSSKNGEILEVKRVKECDGEQYIVLSNHFSYFPEMIEKIL